MKPLLLLILASIQYQSFGQIAFEEITSPEDFSLAAIRVSPAGEYFVQASNDYKSIYSSMDGEQWTKSPLPERLVLNDMQFFSDGTPLFKADGEEHLIRRNGSWFTMDLSAAAYGKVEASFIRDDSLFVFQDDAFAYSLDKGLTFTTVFTFGEAIIDHEAHLWKFGSRFVLHHTAGASDYLSIFTQNGTRIRFQDLDLGILDITYNSCGQVLFYDSDSYFLLKEQDLAVLSGTLKSIHPNLNSSSEILSEGGKYYFMGGNSIYRTTGCNFIWEALATDDLIGDSRHMLIDPQENIIIYDRFDDYFFEQKTGTNTWDKHLLNINYASVSGIEESSYKNQIAFTTNALFSKRIDETNWVELDSSAAFVSQVQYSPDGDLYVNRRSDILYSKDNGISFNVIQVPPPPIPGFSNNYIMEVLDDDIIFIIGGHFNESFYTLNNGQDWIEAGISFHLDLPKVKLINNYILVADLMYQYEVSKINIATNEVTTEILGDFYNLTYSEPVIQDDGTIYFQGFEINGSYPGGLYRYRYGGVPQFIGQFPELEYVNLDASGTDLYAFDQGGYYLLDGDSLIENSYNGMPGIANRNFYISGNEYLYVIADNNRIFRSTMPLSFPKHITGSIYKHTNQDCVVDTLDATLKYWQVKVENDEFLRIKTTDTDGNFTFSVPDGEYTLSSQPLNSNWDLCETTYVITVDENTPDKNVDFLASSLRNCAELEIDFSTPFLRRCFDNVYSIRVRNTGPEASQGTALTLKLDSYFEFISATIPHTQIGDSILRFDLGIMQVGDEISFKISFNLSCDAPLGTEHCLEGILSDINLCGDDRSTYIECQENIGSFDPNDKRIFNEAGDEVTTIDKGEYIYYHIRFQNTGTDTAFKVVVEDALSPMLDLGTMEMLSSSHPYDYFISDGPALVVIFENILLPDSNTNEAASHGFFKFRIKPRPQFDYGTSIPNQAGIYFDFNDAVLTNEATLVILPTVGIKKVNDFIGFDVFPNPVRDFLSLITPEDGFDRIETYEIIDPLGRLVHRETFSNKDINVSQLTPGVYNMVLKRNGAIVGMKKFVRL